MPRIQKIKMGLIVLILFLVSAISVHAHVRLPKLISDGMVLQRNSEVKIWGWAEKNENITIHFINIEYQTFADELGEWIVKLKDLSAGGPHKMTIKGSNTVVVDNILIGDVWVCSGQSNMNYKLGNAKSIYEKEIAQADNPNIRCFTVPEVFNFTAPQKEIESGNWITTTPETVLKYSAVSYFFAAELYDKYQVPIGLIHSSKSGSPAQAWISKEAIKKFPHYYDEAVKYEDPSLIDKIISEEKLREDTWYKTANSSDEGYKSPGTWFNPATNTSDWESMNIPGYIAREPIGNTKGVFWFRKLVQIPESMIGKDAVFKMGNIVNSDSVYINGIFIGTTGHQWASRSYSIPVNLLKAGANTIVMRLVNHNGYGGFLEGYPYQIVSGEQTVNISGEWKYRLGAKMESLPGQTQFNWKATGLFNGMISPLTNFTMKGVIWYQGEGNAGKAKEYESLFPCLIRNWRENWHQGDFPFLFVQLANYMKPTDKPSSSNWAILRESQRKTLDLPNTGMAVAIDVGVAHDVHPMNKKDIGYRLALEAQRVAYGNNKVVSAGPLYKSMKIKGDKIIISFETYGSKLKIKDEKELQYFSIASSDKKFVWAQAKISKNKIVVSNAKISNPVAVRYAWANNPESANLSNEEGLPASPFRTDNWEK